ncbi:DUF4349 domain-containing protein [Paenibacillus shirakamiensis]|nr:DUF4349 domain-containing protein [Paenibacillus shirakamiensis]
MKRDFRKGFILLMLVFITACGTAQNSNAVENKESFQDNVVQTSADSTASPEVPASEKSTGTSDASIPSSNKKLIYTANMDLKVQDYTIAQDKVRTIVTQRGGYILQFSENKSDDNLGGNFVVKVPAKGFAPLMKDISLMKHESMSQSMEGQDVTEQYVDMESRLKVKEIMEQRYLDFLKRAEKTSDLVSFSNELGKIQEEIEQIRGKMKYLDHNIAYSTITIHLSQSGDLLTKESGKVTRSIGERASDALRGTLNGLGEFGKWIIIVLAGALPILGIAGIILWMFWLYRRRKVRLMEQRRALYSKAEEQLEIVNDPLESTSSHEDIT